MCSVNAYDGTAWGNWTNSSNLTIQNTAPTITVINPTANQNLTSQSVTFALLPKDGEDLGGLWTAIYLNISGGWVMNGTNTSAFNNTQTNITSVLPDGVYKVAGFVNDTSGLSAFSSNVTFLIDSTAPTITLPFYTNATQKRNIDTLTLNVSVSDVGVGGSSCYIDVNGTNQTFSVSNGWCNTTLLYLTGLTDGNKTIRVYANDTLNNMALNNSYVVWIDTTAPVVTLLSPENNTLNYTTNLIDFYYNVSDSSNIQNCSLIINSSINLTVNNPTRNTTNNLTIYLPDLVYTWQVRCTDIFGNIGDSEVRNIFINVENAISISFSENLSQQIRWNLESLPAINLSALGNNDEGVTSFWINISTLGGGADIYVKANSDLISTGGDILGLENETYSYSSTNPLVPSLNKSSITTNYIDNKIGNNLGNSSVIYLKFFLNAPPNQPAGIYNNTLTFKAVPTGQSP